MSRKIRIQIEKSIILLTKCDLSNKINISTIKNMCPNGIIIPISVKQQIGIDDLYKSIVTKIENIKHEFNFIKTERELDILRRAKKHLEDALNTLTINTEIDLITIDLNSTLNLLDELTGESFNDDVINEIFSKFCIGK